MVDENKISSYQEFYKTILKFLKKSEHGIDWSILEKHKGFVESLYVKTVYDNQIETVQKEFDGFIKELTRLNQEWMICYCASFNSNIDLKNEIEPQQQYDGNLLMHIALAALHTSAISDFTSRKLKRLLRNTHQSLLTIKKCLTNCGLLMVEINKRQEYTLYNFVLIDKTNPKRETFSHYLITKEQLDDYINTRNEGKSMNIKGRFWQYSPKTDITITATKFKNVEEINLYKKLISIRDDRAFSKSAMCIDKTTEFISPKVPQPITKAVKSIYDLIKESKIKEALELALKKTDISQEDKTDITFQLARLNKLEKDNKKGIISDSEYRLEYHKLTDAVIQKMQELGYLDNPSQ